MKACIPHTAPRSKAPNTFRRRRKAVLRSSAAVLCLALFTGCANTVERILPEFSGAAQVAQPAPAPVPILDRIRVAVIKEDSLNPYTLTTRTNGDLTPLLYDPLVKLDEHYQPQNYLAGDVKLAGTVCTVRLRQDVVFSDGKALTAADAAYSLECCIAQDGGRRYSNVSSYRAVDEHTLEILLVQEDLWFKNLLTFPIIEEGTLEQRTPPGTGRYIPAGENHFKRNDKHFQGASRVTDIQLVPVSDSKEIGYELLAGGVDYALLEPESSRIEMTGGFLVQTNNMLYLGFNNLMFPTETPAVRQAIHMLVDREALVSEACRSRAVAAPYPINPVFYETEIPSPNVENANALLDAMGLTEIGEDGFRVHYDRPVELQLAINVESADKRALAALLKKQIERAKIKVTINEYSFEQYKKQVSSGGYSMYLGEIKLPEDMDISALLGDSGSLHYFLGDTSELYQSYLSARRGEEDYADFLELFRSRQPFVPLLFQETMISHSRNFYSSVVATQQDIFYNIHKW